jgi:predicted alpha/beta-fold hydrolase
MHFRGCSGEVNRLPRSYHSGDTADAKAWINTLKQRYPQNPLFAIGFSIGGNMLLKLLGEWRDSSPLCAAVSVSAPLQLDVCSTRMNQGFSKFYQYVLLKELKQGLVKKFKQYDMKSMIGIEENEVSRLNSFWVFDDVYTGPIHGFKSASDYYQQSSSKQYLKDITTQTLIIHALDDPFMSPEIIPKKETLPANIKLEIQTSGGHLGFISQHIFRPQYWLEERITQFFSAF